MLAELGAIDRKTFQIGKAMVSEETEIRRAESRIRSAESAIARLEAEMQRVRRTSNARAVRMYKNGPGTILATLFTAERPGDLPRLSQFWESLARRDGKALVEAARVRTEIDAQKTGLASAVNSLQSRVGRLDDQKAGLEAVRQQRAASLEKLKAAVQAAMDAEKKILAELAAAAIRKPAPGPCAPGTPGRDQRLATLLDWYAPAAGSAGFVPAKLSPTGVIATGPASWYGPGFDGCRSASGATFRASQMTAASVTLPLGTFLKVTRGGRAVVVVITDRGPYAAGRVLDLSAAAAQAIGLGTADVDMEILLPAEPAPPFP